VRQLGAYWLTLEDPARWTIKKTLVDGDKAPDFRSSTHFRALAEVKPEAVTVAG
jgi:hypothetical protein